MVKIYVKDYKGVKDTQDPDKQQNQHCQDVFSFYLDL